jgi:hypothetical protein
MFDLLNELIDYEINCNGKQISPKIDIAHITDFIDTHYLLRKIKTRSVGRPCSWRPTLLVFTAVIDQIRHKKGRRAKICTAIS